VLAEIIIMPEDMPHDKIAPSFFFSFNITCDP
jgi:hypothetical protein